MKSFIFKGGVRSGIAEMGYPFAELYADFGKIEIQTYVESIIFSPADVIDIIPYSGFSTNGIRIIHRKYNIPEKIIFWTVDQPEIVIKKIRETGFMENVPTYKSESDSETLRKAQQSSYPLEIHGFFLILGLFFLMMNTSISMHSNWNKSTSTTIVITILLSIILSISLMYTSASFRKMITKQDHNLKTIRIYTSSIFLLAVIFLIYVILKITA